MKRRTFLKGTAAVTVLMVGGVVYRSYDQGLFTDTSDGIYEAWENWDTDSAKGPLALVRAAILAANPHNTQPWLFKVTEHRIELYADLTRHLGSFDPYRREMHLGLGCALENLALAAEANGFQADITLSQGSLLSLGETTQSRVAEIILSEAEANESDLYQAIPKRHTNRGPYDPQKELSSETLSGFESLADDESDVKIFLLSTYDARKRFGDVLIKSTEIIIADSVMVHDSESWMRHSWDDMKKYRSGISVDAAGLPTVMTAIAKILPPMPEETNSKYWLQGTRDIHVATTPVFGLIAVRDLYDRAQNLQAGRIWQRMHLSATTQGIAMHPVNQPVELVDRERELGQEPKAEKILAELTGDASWKPTFSFRTGYALNEAKRSPRRIIEDVLL